MPYYAVIPCHNRNAITLRCLRNLRDNGDLDKVIPVVVDDGSTDGTSEAVENEFPEAIVLRGDGNLWWGGAINVGTRWVLTQNDSKGVFWLNDDSFPRQGTIAEMIDYSLSHPNEIIGAYTFVSPSGLYSGYDKSAFTLKQIEYSKNDVGCNALCGNCVFINVAIIQSMSDENIRVSVMPHYLGDVDYTLRASKRGWKCVLLSKAICDAVEDISSDPQPWLSDGVDIIEVWKLVLSPKSAIYWKARFYFYISHWSLIGFFIALVPYLKLTIVTALIFVLPKHFLRSLLKK